MKATLITLLWSLAFGSVCLGGDSPPANISLTELQSQIEKILHDTHTPGASVAIASRDRIIWTAGLGLADVANHRPATADTLFRIGSISKGFAALATLKLEEEGKLRLSDPVAQWAPELPLQNRWGATDPVRLVHLLEHTAGFDELSFRDFALADPALTLEAALKFSQNRLVSRWRPGSRAAYSNLDPGVLAYVIEKVSGRPFEDFVQTELFDPLHMRTASYRLTPTVQSNLATLYAGGETPVPYWHLWLRPAGSINVSARDLANYLRLYLGRGTIDGVQVLQRASLDRMEQGRSLPAAQLGDFAGYGLYNVPMWWRGYAFHGHDGGQRGGVAWMMYSAELDRGLAVAINSDNYGALIAVRDAVARLIVQDHSPPGPPAPAVVPDHIRSRFSGFYKGISPRIGWVGRIAQIRSTVRVTVGARELSARHLGNGQTQTWVAMSDRLFRGGQETRATLALLPDQGGSVIIQTSDVTNGTWQRVSALEAWGPILLFCGVGCALTSSLLFGALWVARKLCGKLSNPGPWGVRAVPLASSALFLLWNLIIGLVTLRTGQIPLGRPSFASVGLWLTGLAFAASVLWGLVAVWRGRAASMNRVAYWHSALVALAATVAAGYMVGTGLIVQPPWMW